MKKTTKIIGAVLSLAICTSWSLFPGTKPLAQTLADSVKTVYQVSDSTFKYNFLSKDEMPILGYVSIPPATDQSPSFITKSNFLRYKDAGFNIVSGLYEREPFSTPEVRKAMAVAEETDLVYFVNDVAFRCDSRAGTVKAGTYESYYEKMENAWYLNESAFGGIAVKDEPSAKDFDAMAHVSKSIKALAPGKILYTNLFPSYVGSSRLYLDDTSGSKWDMYERYVREFVDKVQPDILAYDYYVFMKEDATLENTYGSINPVDLVAGQLNVQDYLNSLSLFRELSQTHDIPFWVTVASYNHRHKRPFTQKQMTWTVNTSLAYGAKGIQYYTYWPTMESSSPDDWDTHDRLGVVTLNGTPKDNYYYVKAINENIKSVDDILMTSTHRGVMQFGKAVLPMVQKDTLHNFGLLNSITGGDAFVGCFERDGKEVYYIVNNSINAGRQTFQANFLNKVSVRLTNSEGSTTINDSYAVGFNLSGGQAILLEVL